MRAVRGVPSLRSHAVFSALKRSIGRATRARFRVIHFSVQADHLHFVIEADATSAFEHGMRGLAILTALAINRAAHRHGRVWEHRFHAHELRTPTEVRSAIAYVLLNFRKHLKAAPGIDPRSSGVWFADWVASPDQRHLPRLVAAPQTWLGAVGWRRGGGPLSLDEAPRERRRHPR